MIVVTYIWIYISLILHLKTPAWGKVQGPVLIHDEAGLGGIKKKKSMQVMDALIFLLNKQTHMVN